MKKKRQHYVPRFYINRFLSKNDTISVFDKLSGHSFETKTENVSVEKYFYDFDSAVDVDKEDAQFLENILAEMESEYAILLNELFQSISKTRQFDRDLKSRFSLYLIIQLLRTREYREKEAQLRAAVIETINQEFRQQGYRLKYGYDDEAMMHFISMFDPKKLSALIAELLKKTWLIWKNKTSQKFYTSDNPIIVISGNIEPAGFASPEAEILYPLSSNYLLDIFDPQYFSNREKYDCKVVNLRDLKKINRFNKAQVKFCTRQIYCSNNDFDLAQDMVEKNPEIREPRRKRIKVDEFGDEIIRFSST